MRAVKTGEQLPDEHHPKLKMAAKEIKDIMERYDIVGVVQLYTPGFAEYAMNISPSFSCVSVNDVGHLRITDPIEDPQNPEAAKKKIADTVNMVANLSARVMLLARTLMQADIALRTRFNILPPTARPNNGMPPIKN